MFTRSSVVYAPKIVLEQMEERIVLDGAVDDATSRVDVFSLQMSEVQTDTENRSEVLDGNGLAAEYSADVPSLDLEAGTEWLPNGAWHYWEQDWAAGNGYRYDYYLYPNGMSSWVYQGSIWDVNGNGWHYSADSSGYWEYAAVDWDTLGNGWEYAADSSGNWTYQTIHWSDGYGCEYVGSSDGQWYYHVVGDDGTGVYEFLGNSTGYYNYSYTWDNGATWTGGSGTGDSGWYWNPDVTEPVQGEWFVSTEQAGYYQYEFPQSYYDATTHTYEPVYTCYTSDFETYYYYFPAVYYSNYGDSGFALHPVNGIGGDPGVNESWNPDCPVYDAHGIWDQWYVAGDGEYMEGWWTYNDSDGQYSIFTQDFQTYDYYFIGFWYSSTNGYDFHLESAAYAWELPNAGSIDSPFVPTADHVRVGIVETGSEWNDEAFHYADPAYNAEDDFWTFTIIGDNTGEVLLRYYVENPSADFDPWAIVNGTDPSTLNVYVGMYYDEDGTYWGMEQDYLQENVRAIWYDLPDFNVESWSFYTQLLAHAENATIDQMVYSGHGNVNNFWVGEDVIASWNIVSYAADLQGIGTVMSEGAQLQLWECLIAGTPGTSNANNARHMLADLAHYTDSTVFASAESTWMIQPDNHITDSPTYLSSDWTLEFGVNPSGYQVAYTTLVYHVYDKSGWDPDWRDIRPYGEAAGAYNWLTS